MVRVILFICMAMSAMMVSAQETLNIHTKDKGVVSIPFVKKPQMTFAEANVLKVVSSDKTVEYPFKDIEKLSFENASSDDIHLIRHQGSQTGISVYDLSGKLIGKGKLSDGLSAFDLQTLPPGIYIVKDGDRSYKLIKP